MDTALAQQFAHLKAHGHALLVVGVHGNSSRTEADYIARQISGSNGLVQIVQKIDGKIGISIQQIRDLYRATRSKSVTQKRIWIISSADTMSHEAQNAFLKLLEEPPKNVIFIISVHSGTALLPTILSRVQTIQCKPFTRQAVHSYVTANLPTDQQAQIVFLADGSISELVELTTNQTYRQKQLERAHIAKQFLNGTTFEKISSIHALGNDREQALAVLTITLKMLTTLATRQAKQANTATKLQCFITAYERIAQNGNIKIQLLRAVL